MQSKALLGWTQYLAGGFDREDEIAYQWQRAYDRLRRQTEWRREDLLQVAWHYLDEETGEPEVVLDPLDPIECRYSPSDPSAFAVAISYTRQLALAYAKTRGVAGSEDADVNRGTPR